MFPQSTNTEENTDASETNLDQVAEYEENEDGNKLGRLFFTVLHKFSDSFIPKVSIAFSSQVKYSFEKTALIVTINKCSNLPAKDSTNKTR